MKTSKQVRQYLRKQPWYKYWRKFTYSQNTLLDFFIFMLGDSGPYSLMGFNWRNTIQGYKFWEEADKQLRAWYYGKE